MSISMEIGFDVVNSYKRLAYQPWFALAEFVDNSTQGYFNNESLLNEAYKKSGESLTVRIVYDADPEMLRISDNSIGMNLDELRDALRVAKPPKITSGRSKYGMGMKTAACWLGNEWTIRTKKLGETTEHFVRINVEAIAAGNNDLPYQSVTGKDPTLHYTIIEIIKHNRRFHGRTLGKIKDFLSSMYREDFRKGTLILEWRGARLSFPDIDSLLLKNHEGDLYKKEFQFSVDGKQVKGWVGILDKGSRASAGFAIIHCGRVVRGWPDAWRPESLYGQYLGSNDLVNQRLIGEIHLDGFDVSHTKDDILWLGDQEDQVEEELRKSCEHYKEIAQNRRKSDDDERGPAQEAVDAALDELKREIQSPEMVDKIKIEDIPPQEVVDQTVDAIVEAIGKGEASFSAKMEGLEIRGYLATDMSPNDPYVTIDTTKNDRIVIIINMRHPHIGQLKGSDGVLNYFRHCTYDGIAEWKALHKAARVDPNTIKMLKDALLRIPFEIEMHQSGN